MPDTSNINEVVAYLQGIVDDFNFTRPGTDGSLGRDVRNLEAERIELRSGQNKTGPDGSPWPANAPTYADWKNRKYGWSEVNKKTGRMLSLTSLKGDKTTIEKDLVTLRYGTEQATTETYSPADNRSEKCKTADGKVTDLQKAEYAHTGGKHGKKRPFYGVGEGDAEAITELCQKNLDQFIAAKNAGH